MLGIGVSIVLYLRRKFKEVVLIGLRDRTVGKAQCVAWFKVLN